jgi:uncharacterized protein YdeI (YjbR/CyaY-like superfamily)
MMDPKVDFFFEKAKQWKEEYELLREIVIECDLVEELKWGCPCYTFDKKNIVLIHGFKEYCALLFFKGALLKDPKGLLIQQTENVQSARQLRFTNVGEVRKLKKVIKAFIYNAVEVEEAGLKVALKQTKEYPMADEFKKKLQNDRELKTAFNALTPGRQRGYLMYFSEAKQSKTRESRIEKCVGLILEGKGLQDR